MSSDGRVGLMRTADLASEWTSVLLDHPRLGQTCEYFVKSDGSSLLESHQTDGSRPSWFVDDAVKKDGGLTVLTPVNGIFLVLPYLFPSEEASRSEKRAARYSTIEQLLDEHDASSLVRLRDLEQQLDLVCDTQHIDDIGKLYRINKEKLTAWLVGRVDALVARMASLPSLSASQKAVPVTFSLQLVSEHLPEHIEALLREALGDRVEAKPAPKPAVGDLKDVRPTEDYGSDRPLGPAAKKVKLTTQQKALAEQAKGMKSMASFFQKK